MVHTSDGRIGRDLAKLLAALMVERGIRFGAALTLVLEDERVSQYDRADDVRDEAVHGFLSLQEMA
ncbi:hypothetical protein [Actinomadura decatromicini]|uniref:Uncharacterized protein n=1 Tax=Actinomadura decatromicini TaxID=2604572 RepID=A0A5D3F9U5_9ACTN|nr:hypothetical protein [Actinomadura decatromicini]TYK45091.1 hypothetical protein FXF68_30890 [Actinomadura decatromicini]